MAEPFDDPTPDPALSVDVDHYLYGAPRPSSTAPVSALCAVFVDTGAWVALRYRRDQYHERATKLAERLDGRRLRLVMTEWVLVEAVTLLKARAGFTAYR